MTISIDRMENAETKPDNQSGGFQVNQPIIIKHRPERVNCVIEKDKHSKGYHVPYNPK